MSFYDHVAEEPHVTLLNQLFRFQTPSYSDNHQNVE